MFNGLDAGVARGKAFNFAMGGSWTVLDVVRTLQRLLHREENGRIRSLHHLRAGGEHWGIELPARTFHSLVVLEADTVVLEIKEGPYEPQDEKEFLPGFPEEGAPEAPRLVASWWAHFKG